MYSIFRCYKHPTEEDDMGPVIKESWRGRRQVIGTKILFLPDSINLLQCPSTCCSNTSYTSPKVHFTRVKVTLSDVLCWFWKGWHFCHLISHFRHLVSNFTMHGDRQRLFTTHLGLAHASWKHESAEIQSIINGVTEISVFNLVAWLTEMVTIFTIQSASHQTQMSSPGTHWGRALRER